MKLSDLMPGDHFRMVSDGGKYEYLNHEGTLVRLRLLGTSQNPLAHPNEEVALTGRRVENIPIGGWFYIPQSGNWQVQAKHPTKKVVIAKTAGRSVHFAFGTLVDPANVKYVIGKKVDPLDDDRLWELAHQDAKRWSREAMYESIRKLGSYQHGCPGMTEKFEELHRVCEYIGLDFWDIAFNMCGFAACRLIISSVLKSKGFKDGAKEVAVNSDPAKDPRGDLLERIFRSDFI